MSLITVEVAVEGSNEVLFMAKWPTVPDVGERFTHEGVDYKVTERAWGVCWSDKPIHDSLCVALSLVPEEAPAPRLVYPSCALCGNRLDDVTDVTVPDTDDDVPTSMQGRLWLFTGLRCSHCGDRKSGRYTQQPVEDF
jgi:hypothetical protein